MSEYSNEFINEAHDLVDCASSYAPCRRGPSRLHPVVVLALCACAVVLVMASVGMLGLQ